MPQRYLTRPKSVSRSLSYIRYSVILCFSSNDGPTVFAVQGCIFTDSGYIILDGNIDCTLYAVLAHTVYIAYS